MNGLHFLGLVGTMGLVVSDVLLLARPVSGCDFYLRYRGRDTMRFISNKRLLWGGGMGVLCMPLVWLGVWRVYGVLLPAGQTLSLLFLIPLTITLLLATAIHALFAPMGLIMKQPELRGLDRWLFRLWWVWLVPAGVACIVSSVAFSLAVSTGLTLFDEWMMWWNPAGVFTILLLITFALPKPLGGYLAPPIFSLTMFFFFLLAYPL